MLCKFTGGGPENGSSQEIADDVSEVRCTGLTPGYSEIYTRDPSDPAKFIYCGQVANEPYVPGFDHQYESIDDVPLPDWAKGGPVYDLETLQPVKEPKN